MNRPLRILIVEDSEDDAELLLTELRLSGYEPRPDRVETAEAMTAALERQKWDLVVSDYSMPRFSATAALKLLREREPDLPFIIVSGAIGEARAVEAMKAGAQDYVMKGNMTRLAPAIERELREAEVRRERKRVEEENERYLKRIRILHEIDVAITSTLDLSTVLNILLDKIDLVLPGCATVVRLFNSDSGKLEPVAYRNLSEEEWGRRKSGAGGKFPRALEDSSLPVTRFQTPPHGDRPLFHLKLGSVSYLGVPLVVKGKALGLISFSCEEEKIFSEQEVEFLSTLAGQAAIALHNSQLYEQATGQAAELARKNIALEKSDRVKSEFLGVMSHELRTPLSIIMGYAAMLQEKILGGMSPDQDRVLQKILSRSKDLLAMINGILQVTMMESRMINVDSKRVRLEEFLEDVKPFCDVPQHKGVSISWDVPSRLPAIETDSGKLRQILRNLIHNAIKFTSQGQVKISVRMTENGRQNANGGKETASPPAADCPLPTVRESWVEFKVADTGIGITAENLPHIFEVFYQADSSERRSFGGVGIGLYTAKKLTEILGGTIEVESAPGAGSTFTLSIPCNPPATQAQLRA